MIRCENDRTKVKIVTSVRTNRMIRCENDNESKDDDEADNSIISNGRDKNTTPPNHRRRVTEII